eukprot:766114-Hanusia_phi.AAC.12
MGPSQPKRRHLGEQVGHAAHVLHEGHDEGDGAEGEARDEGLHHLAVPTVLVHLLAEEDEGEDAGGLDALVLHARGQQGDDGAALEQRVEQEEQHLPGGPPRDVLEVVLPHEDHHDERQEAREGGGLVEGHAVHAGVLRVLHRGGGEHGQRDAEEHVDARVADLAAENDVLWGRVVGTGRQDEGEQGSDDAHEGEDAEAAVHGDLRVVRLALHETQDLQHLHPHNPGDE